MLDRSADWGYRYYMKTNYSRADIEKFTASLVTRGWSKQVEGEHEAYMSPMTTGGNWVNVSVSGRNVRTVASWDMKTTKRGLVNAGIAAQTLSV